MAVPPLSQISLNLSQLSACVTSRLSAFLPILVSKSIGLGVSAGENDELDHGRYEVNGAAYDLIGERL